MVENNNWSKSTYWNKATGVLERKTLFKKISSFKAHNIMGLSCYEQKCMLMLCFKRCVFHIRALRIIISCIFIWNILEHQKLSIAFQIYKICYYWRGQNNDFI